MNLPTTAKSCGTCNKKESFILHNVRVRGVHRRLCTSCVLRAHPASFCPYCFAFFDTTPPPPSKRLACTNCSSFSHSHCATSSLLTPFLCPPCADPNFTFFKLLENTDGKKVIDKKLATVLLCAAKIASNSMAKAVNVARSEAERRVREAAVCRKRAREALEHVMLLAKRKETDNNHNNNSVLGKRDRDGNINGNVVDVGVVSSVNSTGNVDNNNHSNSDL